MPGGEPAPDAARDSDGGDMEAAILDASREILAREGIDALSMRAVAGRVGVSATALYHYFQNKRELVDRVVATTFEHHEAYLREAASEWPAGSLERLRAIAKGYVDFALEHEQYFRALFALRSERLREMEDHPARGIHELTNEAVTAAMDAGNLERRDPETVGLYIWSSVHGLVTLSLACKLEQPPGGRQVRALELFERSWEMMVAGLRPREGWDGAAAATREGHEETAGEDEQT